MKLYTGTTPDGKIVEGQLIKSNAAGHNFIVTACRTWNYHGKTKIATMEYEYVLSESVKEKPIGYHDVEEFYKD